MEYYNPATSRKPQFRNLLNQYSATSGSVPPPSALDRIIQGELDASSQNLYRNAGQQLQQQRLDQMKTEQDRDAAYRNEYLGLQRANLASRIDAVDSARTTGLVQSLLGLGTTAAGLVWKPKDRKIF